mmetsp:Transcript_24323/g.76540  ORF Transcript_24323/g.76540 Transcript_24323/m.76540 type:complete len:150 (+) Transcript_24323:389-838(+)
MSAPPAASAAPLQAAAPHQQWVPSLLPGAPPLTAAIRCRSLSRNGQTSTSRVPAPPPTPTSVQVLCEGLAGEALRLARAQGWTGTFTEFEARSYRSRLAASGRRTFFVKVQTSLSEVIHLRVTRAPHGGAPSLEAARVGRPAHAPIEVF